MIIAVTGANGHVGVNLCKRLLELGHDVRAFTHRHSSALKDIHPVLIQGDLLEPETIRPLVKGAEVVFHLAARISIAGDPDGDVYRLNAEGTRNILQAAREAGVRKFIHFSSIHAIRQKPLNELLDEERELVREDGFAYDRSKADGERTVLKAAREEGFDAVVLSPTAIIGPMDPEPGLLGQAFLQLYHGKIPALVPGGYDMIDVRDLVEAAISAIDRGRKGEKYMISGKWHSIGEIARIIERHTGRRLVKTEMPFWIATIGLPFILAYSKISGSVPLYTRESLIIIRTASRKISSAKAQRELGFRPRPVEATVTDLFDWFKGAGYLDQLPKKND